MKSNYDLLSSFAYGTLVSNPLEVHNYLKSKNIECRPLICGSMGRQPFWIKKFGVTKLQVADQIHDFGIYLPIHANLNNSNIKYVCDQFKKVAKPYNLAT
jgi:CDP-6-deoxy-D-xylo-4-hexulose-3-dehydrase